MIRIIKHLLVYLIMFLLTACITVKVPVKVKKEIKLPVNEYTHIISQIKKASAEGYFTLKKGRYYFGKDGRNTLTLSRQTRVTFTLDFSISKTDRNEKNIIITPDFDDFRLTFSEEVTLDLSGHSVITGEITLNNQNQTISSEQFQVQLDMGKSISRSVIATLFQNKDRNTPLEKGIKELFVEDLQMTLKPDAELVYKKSLLHLEEGSSFSLKDLTADPHSNQLQGLFSLNFKLKKGSRISGEGYLAEIDTLKAELSGNCSISEDEQKFRVSGSSRNSLTDASGILKDSGGGGTRLNFENVNLKVLLLDYKRQGRVTFLDSRLKGSARLMESAVQTDKGLLVFESAEMKDIMLETGETKRFRIPSLEARNASLGFSEHNSRYRLNLGSLRISRVSGTDWNSISITRGDMHFTDIGFTLVKDNKELLSLNAGDDKHLEFTDFESLTVNSRDNPVMPGVRGIWDRVSITLEGNNSLELQNCSLEMKMLSRKPFRAALKVSAFTHEAGNLLKGTLPVQNLALQMREGNFIFTDKSVQFEIPSLEASLPYDSLNTLVQSQIPESLSEPEKKMSDIIIAGLMVLHPFDAFRLERFRFTSEVANLRNLVFSQENNTLKCEGKLRVSLRFLADKTHLKPSSGKKKVLGIKIPYPSVKTEKSQVTLHKTRSYIEVKSRLDITHNAVDKNRNLKDFTLTLTPVLEHMNIRDFPDWLEGELEKTARKALKKQSVELKTADFTGNALDGLGQNVSVTTFHINPKHNALILNLGIRGQFAAAPEH